MDFREFATNYLNPIFLLYRAILLTFSFYIFFLSFPIFANSTTSRTDLTIILAISLVLTVGLYMAFRRRSYLLYLVIPLVLIFVAISIRINYVVSDEVLPLLMTMSWCSAFLIAFNGFRSWGYGMSMNDISNKVNDKLNDLQK